jgi:hypothetical protein
MAREGQKFLVVGVERIEGNMCRLYCLVPITPDSGKIKVTGSGWKVAEMDMDAEALPSFASVPFTQGPQSLELQIEQRFVFGQYKSVVAGFVAAVPAAGAVRPAVKAA